MTATGREINAPAMQRPCILSVARVPPLRYFLLNPK
jgi:hypothetical protein